jgi:hypothetical protein
MGSWAEGAELGRLSAWLGSFLFFFQKITFLLIALIYFYYIPFL